MTTCAAAPATTGWRANDLFGVPVQDGSIDKLDGFDGTDHCRIPFVEPDITVGCEIIDKD